MSMNAKGEFVDVSLDERVSVSVRFQGYSHGSEYGTILIAEWDGVQDSESARHNERYIVGMMRAALAIKEPSGAILDLSGIEYRGGGIYTAVFLCMSEPTTQKMLPSAVVVNSDLYTELSEQFEDIEQNILGNPYVFTSFDDALNSVVPKIVRFGLRV